MEFDPQIVYEDDALVAINKLHGMVANRAESVDGMTVQDWMVLTRNDLFESLSDSATSQVFLARNGIAHRLDKETSGVMLVAKTPASLAVLMAQFKERRVKKTYLALVHGHLEPEIGNIWLPIRRSSWNRQRFEVGIDGKEALTDYEVEQYFANIPDSWGHYPEGMSLVRLYPRTGRTHQIRVHMMHVGHALIGDALYGGRKRSSRDREWLERHFLHAEQIQFEHPVSGEIMNLKAPLSEELAAVLKELEEA